MENLAKKITTAVQQHYSWWDLPDEEDLFADIADMLSTHDGCKDLLNQLCDMMLS